MLGLAQMLASGKKPPAFKAVVWIVAIAVLIKVMPDQVTRVAYNSDWPRYQGCARACQAGVKMLHGAVEQYREKNGELPHDFEQLVPDYIESVPRCPGHVLYGATDADLEEQDYILRDGVVNCVDPPVKPTFELWKKQRDAAKD